MLNIYRLLIVGIMHVAMPHDALLRLLSVGEWRRLVW